MKTSVGTVFQRLVQLVFYGNWWIALAAICQLAETELLLGVFNGFAFAKYRFLFGGALVVYSVHRLISLRQLQVLGLNQRFATILTIRPWILLSLVAGALLAGQAVFSLSVNTLSWLTVPVLISMGYVLPVFSGHRRLRDFSYWKIVLVALVWSWVTVGIPFFGQSDFWSNPQFWLLLAERFCFVFAITIPFDIRDRELDVSKGVLTLAHRFSTARLRRFAYVLLLVGAVFAIMAAMSITNPNLKVLFTQLFVYVLTVYLLGLRCERYSDYFFTGILDGLLILRFVLAYI